MYCIQCGEGGQRIRWLGDVAIFRFDYFFGQNTGTCKGLRFENGTLLRMDDIINEQLQDDAHIWVILKEDIEALGLEPKAGKTNKSSSAVIRPKTANMRK